MLVKLRIKIKSLAAESLIIRQEERRFSGELRADLHTHRVVAVRCECRAASLAYGLLRGRSLAQLESKTHTDPNWTRVREIVAKFGRYGGNAAQDLISRWREGEVVVEPRVRKPREQPARVAA